MPETYYRATISNSKWGAKIGNSQREEDVFELKSGDFRGTYRRIEGSLQ
jgi:hypothetical protein